MLLYKAEVRHDTLVVRISEKNSKRILYLDTLKSLAKESDHEALSLLIKIHLAANRGSTTVSFQQILIPAAHRNEVLKLMLKTGRLTGDLPFLQKQEVAPLKVVPKLVLQDASGLFANLWMDYGVEQIPFEDFAPTIQGRPRLKKEELSFEKDLLEAGFTKKMVALSHYYCPGDKVKEVLRFLLELGWQIQDMRARNIVLQTGLDIDVSEANGVISIKGCGRFGSEEVPLEKLTTQMWVELSNNQVGLLDKKLDAPSLVLKKSQIGAILPLLKEAKWEPHLRELAEGLKNGATLQTALPSEDFLGELLPYQQKGVDWLAFLYRFGFSALLADEMGLGKTVQVLAFLSRVGTNLPVLIVAPTSLLFNWRAEINRFFPSAKNIELTSYTQLRLNAEEFSSKQYEVIILDESNAIKTATTQTAKAAYKLNGRFKICLSGTPMENRSEEILSQFQFLMPDLIDKSDLKQKVRPFILRRRKEEVQIDLPDKIEQVVWIEMEEAELELYESYRKGTYDNRMQMLEIILRLRQVCCDPRLVGSLTQGSKFKQLVNDVQEAIADGRKILVYSQFTSMLQLILKEFPDALYLDGSIAAEKRGELVRTFQEDPSKQLFLLSLKAGGVGLNLTAADYVFLFDPWWNDAVERQAIDRAHRIGQKKTVIAKRYITCNRIEEKMLQLKAKKQQAADELLDFGDAGWSEADLLYLLN